jgi:Rps23 Pro-64 3,4-dihydroxylase Tpa1-like proline 4-hydroxylase
MNSVMNTVCADESMFGKPKVDWQLSTFAFWQFPPGSRLSWHMDAGQGRTGEYILYLHERWEPSWGGELIILDRDLLIDRTKSPLDRQAIVENFVKTSPSLHVAVYPRPNRLVMMRARTCHYINRVEPTAGDSRRTLTGFTYARQSEEKLSQLGRLFDWRSRS